MAKYKSIVTTTAGLELLAAAAAGGTITFTAVKTGSGIYDGTEVLEEATDIKNVQQTFGVTGISRTGAKIKLRTVFSNEAVTTGYDITEIGLYAKDSSNGTETLYAIIVSETGLEDYLPPYEDAPTSITMEIYLEVVEAAEQVTFAAEVIAGTYVPMEEFVEHIEDKYAHITSEDRKKLSGINPATAISATLSASAWTDGAQTVDVEGITAESIYTYDVDNSGATNDIIKAFCKANLTAAASENTITFTANGTTPSIDIPITVVIL